MSRKTNYIYWSSKYLRAGAFQAAPTDIILPV